MKEVTKGLEDYEFGDSVGILSLDDGVLSYCHSYHCRYSEHSSVFVLVKIKMVNDLQR